MAGVRAGLTPQQIEMVKAMMSDCQAKEGGSQGDFDTLMAGKLSGSHEGHCMVACFNEKLGVVSSEVCLDI